jgi:dCMP deaminase
VSDVIRLLADLDSAVAVVAVERDRYNGTAKGLRNCNDGGCPRCNSGGSSGGDLDQCLCLHAEENALLEAGRERLGENTTLYCNTCPCLGCSVRIIQYGVKEVVYHLSYKVYV